jgi:hypothetical protein
MFRPYETIIRQRLLDRNHHTAWAPRQYICMPLLHVVIIQECSPALHSRYFLIAASMLCFIVRNLRCRSCVSCIKINHVLHCRRKQVDKRYINTVGCWNTILFTNECISSIMNRCSRARILLVWNWILVCSWSAARYNMKGELSSGSANLPFCR